MATDVDVIYMRLPSKLKEMIREAAFYQRRDMQDIAIEALTEYFAKYDKHGRLRNNENK